MTRHHTGGEPGRPADETAICRARPASSSEITRLLEHPDTYVTAVIMTVAATLLVPAGWLAVPFCLSFSLWRSTRKFRLPFRLPMAWHSPDYSNPVPGHSRRFRPGQGLLFLGNEHSTEEELWITNSDARRHALILATTGAGKALPLDTLILTSEGWKPNGEIRVGDSLVRPSGGTATVLSVHPQGILPVVRLLFADGRFADCSRDHLWQVRVEGDHDAVRGTGSHGLALMTAADIALLIEANAAISPSGSLSGYSCRWCGRSQAPGTVAS